MDIYIARPITGCTFDEVADYYISRRDILRDFGYAQVFHAFTGKNYLRKEKGPFKAGGYDHPLSYNHAITLRDRWFVSQADVFYLNLDGATRVSIGGIMELAWAYDRGKHCVLVMKEDSPHWHAFVLETAHVVFPTEEEALEYLKKLAAGDL